jgi:tetratricopeptide (TPR) repeat protein
MTGAPRGSLYPVIIVAFLAAAGPARADSAGLEQAKELTNRATIEYDVGKFQQALDLYSKAYEQYPIPVLLFDIGQCHKQLKNFDRAIFFYRGYLRADPSARNRAAVESFINDAQREVDHQREIDTAREQAAEAAAQSAKEGAESPPSAPAAKATSESRSAAPPSPVIRVAGLGTVGLGLVAIGIGTYFGLHANALASDITNVSTSRGTWSPGDQSEYDSGKSSATAANVLYVVGGVAVAAGAVLTYLGWPKGPPAGVSAAIAPTHDGAQFAVVGRF